MKKQISTLAGITIILVVAVIAFGGVFAYEYFGAKNKSIIPIQSSTPQSKSNNQNQVFVPLSGLNFLLPVGWQAKSVDSSDSNATVTDSTNNQFKMSMEIVNSYQDFGSGKYDVAPILTGGSIWDEVSTDSTVPIGIDLYGHDVGPYYNFVADFGNNKVPTGDQNQIWDMVKNAQPYIGYGNYQFEEFAPPNEDWMYHFSITVAADGHGIPAALNIDGFQTETRIVGHIDGSGNTEFIFDNYGDGNTTSQQFGKGDVLFTLTPTINDNFLIQWGKMQPNLQSSLTGSIFKRISD